MCQIVGRRQKREYQALLPDTLFFLKSTIAKIIFVKNQTEQTAAKL